MISKLIKIANTLDKSGHFDLADEIDNVISKIALDFPWTKNQPGHFEYQTVTKPTDQSEGNQEAYSNMYKRFVDRVRRARGRPLTVLDFPDQYGKRSVQSAGGEVKWCERCKDISGPSQSCSGGWSYYGGEREDIEALYFGGRKIGTGSAIEYQVVKRLHDLGINRDEIKKALKEVLKRKVKYSESKGKNVTNLTGPAADAYEVLEKSEVKRKQYDTVVNNILSGMRS
jgi:hypothetical protein